MAVTEVAGYWEARGAEERAEVWVVVTDWEAVRVAESRAATVEDLAAWGEVLVERERQVATAGSRAEMRLRCSTRIGSCSFVALGRPTCQLASATVETLQWSSGTLLALC